MSPSVTWTPGTPVQLVGRRVEVRSAIPDDVPSYVKWASDERVSQFVWSPPGKPEIAWPRMVQAADNRTRFLFTVIHRRDQVPVGYFKLLVEPERAVMVPTIAIGESHYQGGKLAFEISQLVYDWAFAHLDVQAIERRIYADNERVLHLVQSSVGGRELSGDAYSSADRPVRIFRTEREDWEQEAPALAARTAGEPDFSVP